MTLSIFSLSPSCDTKQQHDPARMLTVNPGVEEGSSDLKPNVWLSRMDVELEPDPANGPSSEQAPLSHDEEQRLRHQLSPEIPNKQEIAQDPHHALLVLKQLHDEIIKEAMKTRTGEKFSKIRYDVLVRAYADLKYLIPDELRDKH
jgi:hypothetical protein